tara:strand:- start:504 stop:1415 length:912 start_codon:yes stop_codon:yes gene_type:complete
LIKNFKINKELYNLRLDKWLKKKFSNLNQSFIQKNIRKKNILVNGLKISANYRLMINDEVKILNYNENHYKNNPILKKLKKIPNNMKQLFLDSIIYEDKNFIIIDKWPDIASQGGTGINISIDDIIKNISVLYNLVHRLDKETTGLMIIAKNLDYTKIFGQMFRTQKIEKKYLALCQGVPQNKESIVNIYIENKKNNSKNESITYYKVLKNNNNFSLILFTPKTGKTHQIRIVSNKLGCPIVGDKIHNKDKIFTKEHLKLNSHYLKFNIRNKEYKFLSKIPNHFKNFTKKIELKKINFNNIEL